jgi:hypothetical protein
MEAQLSCGDNHVCLLLHKLFACHVCVVSLVRPGFMFDLLSQSMRDTLIMIDAESLAYFVVRMNATVF